MMSSHSSFHKLKNYLINDFGILGSSISHNKQALEPVEAAREPIQDKNDVNIILQSLLILFFPY